MAPRNADKEQDHSSGQALMEAIIVLPLVLLLLIGAGQLALIAITTVAVKHAGNRAARQIATFDMRRLSVTERYLTAKREALRVLSSLPWKLAPPFLILNDMNIECPVKIRQEIDLFFSPPPFLSLRWWSGRNFSIEQCGRPNPEAQELR